MGMVERLISSSWRRGPRVLPRGIRRGLAAGVMAALAGAVSPFPPAAEPLPGGNCVMPPLPSEWTAEGRDRSLLGPERAAAPELPSLPAELAPGIPPAGSAGFVPVLLVDFSDKPQTFGANALSERLFAPDTFSVRTYYQEVSYGQYDFTGEVVGWFRSSLTKSHYTNNAYGFDTSPSARVDPYHKNIWGLIREVMELADPVVDFSRFDNDGPDGVPDSGDDDGVVDALILIPSGRGAEDFPSFRSDFWSHKFDLRQCVEPSYCPFGAGGSGFGTADGVAIGPYMVIPEIGQIGVACHEYGHILGLPDIYYSGDNNSVSPLGIFCLMDVGAWMDDPDDAAASPGSLPTHLCAWSKYTLGWIDPPAVSFDTHVPWRLGASLPPMAEGEAADPGIFRLLDNPGGADWDRSGHGEGRYFLIENRQRFGFDRGLFGNPVGLGGDGGLLITFVNERRPESGPDPLVYVVQADGEGLEEDGDLPHWGEAADLWPRAGHSPDTFDGETAEVYGICEAELAQVIVSGIEIDPGGGASFDARLAGEDTGVPLAAPNPAVPPATVTISYLPPSGNTAGLRVRLFTLGGTLVRVLDDAGEVDPSLAEAYWDLRDEGGNQVASGLYVYVVEAQGASARGALAVRR